jgi:hypothetical protein
MPFTGSFTGSQFPQNGQSNSMKSDEADAGKMRLEAAKVSVKRAEMEKFLDVTLPHLEIRERIIRRAESLIPNELQPEEYRRFWRDQAVMFVQSPPDFILSLFKCCQEAEAVVLKAMKQRANSKKRKTASASAGSFI